MFTGTSAARAWRPLRNTVIVLVVLYGLTDLVRLAFVRSWNYDELSHAHMAWLLSVGEVPYRDFAINHFPFFWIPISALMHVLPNDPGGLMDLRLVAVFLNLVFVVALGAFIAKELPAGQWIWVAAGFAPVVFNPKTMHFLIEFRPDALANAILFVTLAWIAPMAERRIAIAFACGLLIGAAFLINTKYVLFPFVLGPIWLLARVREIRRVWPAALSMTMGFGAAFVCGYYLLCLMKIVPGDAWRMVVAYARVAETSKIFGSGLANAVVHEPVLLGYVVCGLAGYGILLWRQRRMPGADAVAILIFLTFWLATNTRPWKQYYVSWFLLGAYFPLRALPEFVARFSPRAQFAAACCIAAGVVAELGTITVADPNNTGKLTRATQDALIEYVSREVPADGYVVAGFPLHPVFRRDTFFKGVIDMMADGTDGLEKYMPGLSTATYSEHFQREGYDEDLENHPPSLIVLPPLCTVAQEEAVKSYLDRRPASYEYRSIPGTSINVLELPNAAN